MTTLGVWVAVAIPVAIGLLASVATNWVYRTKPLWATSLRLTLIVSVACLAEVVVTYMQQQSPITPAASDQSAAASSALLVPLSSIDGSQASRTFLATTSSTSQLMESRLDGARRVVVGYAPVGQYAVTRSGEVVATTQTGQSGGLSVDTLAGVRLRTLTNPPAGIQDIDPAVTSSGQVYFLRDYLRYTPTAGGAGTNSTVVKSQAMRVPLSGGSAVMVGMVYPITDDLSVSANGKFISGLCDSGHGTQACVFDLPSGKLRYKGLTSANGLAHLTMSPDGRHLAYESGAGNVYGDSQIWVVPVFGGPSSIVSELPGANTNPAWVTGSRAPCLLFSNWQTSGAQVYLSCLAPHSGVTRIGPGDQPVWLGSVLSAPKAWAGIRWTWGAWWRRYRPALLLSATVALSIIIGLFSQWFEPPSWTTPRRVSAVLAGLVAVQVTGVLLVPFLFGQASGGLTTVAQLDPSQAGDLMLADYGTPGNVQVSALRLDGSNPHPLFDSPDQAFLPTDHTATRFILSYGPSTDLGIELTDSSGKLIRILTRPPPGHDDGNLAIANGSVYFIRSTVDSNVSVLMRVSLNGGAAHIVKSGVGTTIGSFSVDSSGKKLAVACPYTSVRVTNTGKKFSEGFDVCIVNLASGKQQRITSFRPGVGNIWLSPDGRFLAYQQASLSNKQVVNGQWNLYVQDLATGHTVEVSNQPGQNGQVSWVRGGDHPCLLYVNQETSASEIYLACLTPTLAWAPVAPGENPVWLGR